MKKDKICSWCDMKFVGNFNAIYCSKKCKNLHQWSIDKEKYVSKRKLNCISCHNIISLDKNPSTKYCDDDCRIKESNSRRQQRRDENRKTFVPVLKTPRGYIKKYKSKDSSLKKNNWSLEEWILFNYIQNGKCAICLKSNYEQGISRDLIADHCHETGKRRLLLCFKCNLLLGHSNDSIETLYSAIKYLEQHSN